VVGSTFGYLTISSNIGSMTFVFMMVLALLLSILIAPSKPTITSDWRINVLYVRLSGGIDSLLMKFCIVSLQCPDYTLLSKQLKQLNLTVPRFRNHERPDDKIAAIAFDSTGLKRFGKDEWHQEKHKVNGVLRPSPRY
jgi:hypothetical protein